MLTTFYHLFIAGNQGSWQNWQSGPMYPGKICNHISPHTIVHYLLSTVLWVCKIVELFHEPSAWNNMIISTGMGPLSLQLTVPNHFVISSDHPHPVELYSSNIFCLWYRQLIIMKLIIILAIFIPTKSLHDIGSITKLPESDVLCDNITEFGVAEDHMSQQDSCDLPHPKQSDIATQHTRRRLFCVYAMLFI